MCKGGWEKSPPPQKKNIIMNRFTPSTRQNSGNSSHQLQRIASFTALDQVTANQVHLRWSHVLTGPIMGSSHRYFFPSAVTCSTWANRGIAPCCCGLNHNIQIHSYRNLHEGHMKISVLTHKAIYRFKGHSTVVIIALRAKQ